MAGTRRIITKHKELYDKFNQLHIVNEIVINSVPHIRVEQIVNRINGNGARVLSYEKIGNYILIRKHQPFNYSIYHNKKLVLPTK